MSSKMIIIEGNSNDKDNVRAYFVKGEPGDDGFSPSVTVTRNNNKTVTISATDSEGTTEAIVEDGFSPVITTSKQNGVTTITITDAEGTETATINDGETYEVPVNGVIGWDSTNPIPAGYEDNGLTLPTISNSYSTSTTDGYSCNYVNGLTTYSTTETRVGTWIGKPLYRKVFVINKIDTSNSNIDITHGISNLDLFTNVYGSIKRTDNTMNTVPNVNISNTGYLIRIADLDNSLIRVRLGEDIYNLMSTIYVVAEYTKTTD